MPVVELHPKVKVIVGEISRSDQLALSMLVRETADLHESVGAEERGAAIIQAIDDFLVKYSIKAVIVDGKRLDIGNNRATVEVDGVSIEINHPLEGEMFLALPASWCGRILDAVGFVNEYVRQKLFFTGQAETNPPPTSEPASDNAPS